MLSNEILNYSITLTFKHTENIKLNSTYLQNIYCSLVSISIVFGSKFNIYL